ncbi:MAG: tetratricopeptide repeat protein [Burkholderiaceae bacterium]|nr:tetratricopeptide repeat protein [Burkholderiaceae bacterium]
MLTWFKRRSSDSAAEAAGKAIEPSGPEYAPPDRQFHKKHGDGCLDMADWAGAAAAYRRALAIDGNYAEAHSNLALALSEAGNYEEAFGHAERAIALKTGFFNACYLAGTIAHRLGRGDQAVAHMLNAIAIKPDFDQAHSYLGVLYKEKGDRQAAFTHFRQAAALQPDTAEHHYNLAVSWQEQGDAQSAIRSYVRVLELSPGFHAARLGLVHQLQQTCQWEMLDSHIQIIRQHLMNAPMGIGGNGSPFSFLALPGSTAAEQRRCAERWTQENYAPQIRQREQLHFTFERKPHDKIRIGYLSADFHDHATALLMAEIFELHDRRRFHVSAYSYGPDDGSAMRTRLLHAFDRFEDIRSASYVHAAQKIHDDGIDILVDLKGYTGDSRSAILALRPAPIQVNYLGYPGTMGADFVDYLIADRFVIPAESEQDYSERVLCLPDCYQPNDRARARPPAPSRAQAGLPEDAFVFCCFNQSYKITADLFDIWCRLLNAVPGSVLWLIASGRSAEDNLRKEAEQRRVGRERVIFAPRVPPAEHLARQQCADLFLDTLPYNAHTTCSDALWMGLPVVTCIGETFSSRVAGSLLSALGVPELVTTNLQDYHGLALALATDEARRTALRDKIIALRDTAPLFDSGKFTRNLEEAYHTMWANYTGNTSHGSPTA